jgi:hypothetical protein
MNKLFILVFLIFIEVTAFSQNITGIWYRNIPNIEATLIIYPDMRFSIDATHGGFSGAIDGKMTKVKDYIYYSHINEFNQSCVMVFSIDGKSIEIITYGDHVGAGNAVSYSGIYDKEKITKEEYIKKGCEYVIGHYYDINAVTRLLEEDTEYFISCFVGISGENLFDGSKIITGFTSGLAQSQNGIVKIKGSKIYILLTDNRGKNNVFRYYTNDINQNNIPDEFTKWNYYKNNVTIIKKIKAYTSPLTVPSEYVGTMTGPQTFRICLVLGGITDSGEVTDPYYMYYLNGKYGDAIYLKGNVVNDTLVLYENEPNNENVNRALFQFPNFALSKNSLTGIWQDLRSGRFSNRYEVRLSK